MTKNLKYILTVFSVILCLVGFVGLQTSQTSKVYADSNPYIEFTAGIEGESTKLIDIHQNSYGSVVVTYQIVHNDGINSILLVPSYDSSVFKVATVTANDETTYNIVVDGTTVLGAPTITNVANENEAVKILLESTGTNETSKFTGVNSENEYFLTITYDIISATNGTYNFGLNIEPYVVNETSVAYYIKDGEQKGEQSQVEIRINNTALTLVVMQESSITIGANADSEEDEDEVNDYYSFTYTGASATVSKVSELSQVSDNLVVEFTYTGAELQASDFSIVWWASDKYAVKSGNEPLQASPATTGYYLVEITAPASGKYYSTSASRLVLIDKANLVITIDNKQSAYGEPLVALTSSATSELVESLNIVLSTEASSSSNVGNYDITGSCNASSLYNVSFVKGTYTITAKAITITAIDQTATYTGAEPTVDQSKYTVTGVSSISGVEITKAPGVNVGSYTLTPSLSNSNYAVTAVNGIFTITSVGNDADYVKSFFSGKTVGYTAESQDLLVVSVNKPNWIAYSADRMKRDANTYQITVNIEVSAQDAKNYMGLVGDQYFVATVDSEITRANLQVTADNKGHVYGATPATLTPASVNGLGNDVINVTFTVKNGDNVITLANDTPVGSYNIVPSATNSNYNISVTNGTYTVTKATAQDITISATANNINYNRAIDYTVNSVIVNTLALNNYTVVIKDSNNNIVDANTVLNAGTYKVVVVVEGTDNYESATKEIEFTINKINVATPTVTYNKDTASWTVVSTDSGNKELYNSTVSYKINNNDVEGNSYKANSTNALTLTVSSSNDNYLPVNVTLDNVYSVTFNEGTHTASSATAQNMPGVQYAFHGQLATQPEEVPTLTGYTFNAWDFNFATNAITANTTIVALWNINSLTMTVVYVEKTNYTEASKTFTVDYGTEVAVSTYNLKLQTGLTGDNDNMVTEYDLNGMHYEFKNLWSYKVTGSEEYIEQSIHQVPVTATSNLTFVAVYDASAIGYVITYMISVDGGNYTEIENIDSAYTDFTFGSNITYYEASARVWFATDAWYTNEARTILAPVTMPAGNLTVYGAYKFDIGTGDINADGNITSNDITLYRQWIVGGYEMTVLADNEILSTAIAETAEPTTTRYLLTRVADINGDNSKDIRDISITRMAIVGGYNWDNENGYNVTGHEIIRNVNTNVLNTIKDAVVAGKKVTLTGNVSAEGLISIETPYNVYIDLGGKTLTLESFSITSTSRSTITIVNGTIVTTNGITISAPYGNVVLNNVTGYDANGLVNLAAANHSLHFNGNVEFYRGVDTTVANPTPAEIKVEKGTHVVVEPQAKVVVEEIVVTENFVAPQVATEEHVITLDNFSTVTEEIQVVGTVIKNNNEISSFSELMTAVENGGSYILVEDIVYNGQVGFAKDFTLDLNGHTIRSANNVALSAINGATLTINGNGNVIAQEACVMAFDASKVVINGGNYTAIDNFVIGTNGSAGRGGNTITINAGTFNGGITTAGFVACGIYVANSDTVVVNGGTFNVTNGVGILARAGQTTIGSNVVFNVTGNGAFGRVGDSKVTVPAGSELVIDYVANYPGLNNNFSFVNNSQYDVTANASTEANLITAIANADYVKLAGNINLTNRIVINDDLVMNLNGNTITGRLSVFNGDVTINNGKVVGRVDAYDGAVLTLGADLVVENNDVDGCAVVVWGDEDNNLDPQLHVYGTVKATNTNATAISGNGTDLSNSTCVIYSDANVSSASDIAIYWPNDGTLNVKAGATVTGATAIYIKSGNVSIEDNANITSNLSEKIAYAYNGDGANATGDAIVIDNCYYPGANANVTILGEYDVATYWYVKTEQQLRDALAFGGNIRLGDNITVTGTTNADRLAITADTNLDLNGKTIKSEDGLEPTSNWSTLWVNNGAVANISNGTIGSCYDTNGVNSAPYGITVGLANGTAGTVNLTNVNVCGGTSAVYVILGEANIYSGTYQVSPYIENNVENYEFLLNCLDANYIAGTADINVYGGSFENFNPANCQAEGPNTNFMA